MKEIRVQYEHWMNVHSDDWPVRIAWEFLENALEDLPEGERSKLDQKLRDYLERLDISILSRICCGVSIIGRVLRKSAGERQQQIGSLYDRTEKT